MYRTTVLAYFDNNQAAVARALGIKRSSVNAWPELIPERSAYRLQEITKRNKRKLKVDPTLYDIRAGRIPGPEKAVDTPV